jgi:Thiol-disulfide isomerase and thioredoxins
MKNSRNLIILALFAIVAYVFYQYRQPRFAAGEPMPEVAFNMPNGDRAKLSDLRGKYVLLQFWGSWCGPCRRENPELVALYRHFHDRGFEIASIGLERNPRAWQQAIESDGLAWPYHAMESADFDGENTRLFNVRSIPATFLINPEGVIMGVNLKPVYLEKMLKEKLGG